MRCAVPARAPAQRAERCDRPLPTTRTGHDRRRAVRYSGRCSCLSAALLRLVSEQRVVCCATPPRARDAAPRAFRHSTRWGGPSTSVRRGTTSGSRSRGCGAHTAVFYPSASDIHHMYLYLSTVVQGVSFRSRVPPSSPSIQEKWLYSCGVGAVRPIIILCQRCCELRGCLPPSSYEPSSGYACAHTCKSERALCIMRACSAQ